MHSRHSGPVARISCCCFPFHSGPVRMLSGPVRMLSGPVRMLPGPVGMLPCSRDHPDIPTQDAAELMNQQCDYYLGVRVGSGLEQRISHRLSLQSCLLWHEIIGVSGPGNFFHNIQLSWLCVLHQVVHLGSIIHWTLGHVIGIVEINEL